MTRDNLILRRGQFRDYRFCFYGCAFDVDSKEGLKNCATELKDLKNEVTNFLRLKNMEICPNIGSATQLWYGLQTAMKRSAFCIFETRSANQNAHIELGYALANHLRIALLIGDGEEDQSKITKRLPSDLAGLVYIRYQSPKNIQNLLESEIPHEWYSARARLDGIV